MTKNRKFSLSFILNKKFQIVLSVVFVLVMIGNIVSLLSVSLNNFGYWNRFPLLQSRYGSSQYATKHPNWINDEVAFSYAGGALIKGVSPILVVPDAPPLGKYLIGISALLWDNDTIIVLISGILSLFLLFILGKQIYHNTTLALLLPLLVSLEPLFRNQFVYMPLLDLFQLCFILSYFIFMNKIVESKKPKIFLFILTGIFLGCFISTKFFASGATLIIASLLVLLLNKKITSVFLYSVTLSLSLFILVFSYARVLWFGYSLRQLLGIQKWVYWYHQGQLILPFSVWPLLLLNQWYVWFGDKPIIHDPQWQFTWPLLTIISFIYTILYIFKKVPRNRSVEVIMVWIWCYLLFLSTGLTFARYFIILLPALYTVGLLAVKEFYVYYKDRV